MKKLAFLIDDIVATSTQGLAKLASDGLPNQNTSPTISTDLGVALIKTANALKAASTDVTAEDLNKFVETLRNA